MNAVTNTYPIQHPMQSSESMAPDELEPETLQAFETMKNFAESVLMVACFSGLLAFAGTVAQKLIAP